MEHILASYDSDDLFCYSDRTDSDRIVTPFALVALLEREPARPRCKKCADEAIARSHAFKLADYALNTQYSFRPPVDEELVHWLAKMLRDLADHFSLHMPETIAPYKVRPITGDGFIITSTATLGEEE